MATNINEALQEAIDKLLSEDWIEEVTYIKQDDKIEIRPGNYVAKLVSIFHKQSDGYTFSNKLIYINTKDFTYKFHYGGPKKPSDEPDDI